MTKEEIEKFKTTIEKTIIPVVQNMTESQIRDIIVIVEKEHTDLPKGFGKMLYQQIMLMKYNKN